MMCAASVRLDPVCAIVGGQPLLRADALAEIIKTLSGDVDALGPARFDGSTAVLAEVLDEVRTLSLLGGHRIVIVDDADPFVTAHRAALERYCADPSDSGSLILLCKTLPKTTRLFRAIQSVGRVIPCEPPKGRAVVGWVTQRAENTHGKRLAGPAARALVDHIGDSVGLLDAELSKLAAYVGERDEIRTEDVQAMTGYLREEKVFAVTDAISSRDPAGALRCWEQVLATDPAAPGRAVAGLAWGVRRLLEARRDWEGGGDLYALSRSMRCDANVLRRRLERVSVKQLETQLGDLLGVELAVKTGASPIGSAVEKFIVTHAAGPDSPVHG